MTQVCRHCGLTCSRGAEFCCAGCEAVFHALREDGLEAFYELRGDRGRQAAVPDARALAVETRPAPGGCVETTIGLDGVHCAGCVWLVEKMPGAVDGVVEARLNLGRGRLSVRWDPRRCEFPDVEAWLRRFGYAPHLLGADDEHRMEHERATLVRVGVSWALAANVMLVTIALYAGLGGAGEIALAQFMRWIALILSGLSLVYAGSVFFRRAWGSFVPFRGFTRLSVDVPVALGLTIGWAHSAWNTVNGTGEIWFDSVAVLIAALTTARWLHGRGLRIASDATSRLAALIPQAARKVVGDSIETVPSHELAAGDLVEVRMGDVLPADGVVVWGAGHVDRALLTGESLPEALSTGQDAWAGEALIAGVLRVRVTAAGGDTRFGRLVQWVVDSDEHRAPMTLLADRLAGGFVLAILVGAVAAALYAWFAAPEQVVARVVALLVVSCPCALGMATPLAFSVASGRAARAGVFVRNDEVFELLGRARILVLDKTGTLTRGAPSIAEVQGDGALVAYGAAAERHSDHPLSRAFVPFDDGRKVEGFEEVAGQGIRAIVDGRRVRVSRDAAAATGGRTAVLVEVEGLGTASVRIADMVRNDARDLVSRLHAAGVEVWIASGDDSGVVSEVASQVGVPAERALSRQTPESKHTLIRRLRQSGAVVMVGDGVNDAAALREADVGIAMHGGSDVNAIASDAQLGRPGLNPILELRTRSDRAMAAVHRNLAFSAAYNVLAITAALLGFVSPLVAAIAMPLSSLIVVGSSLVQPGTRRASSEDRGGSVPEPAPLFDTHGAIA